MNGLFEVELDFGASVFEGEARWLQVSVRTNSFGMALYDTLSPRQELTPSPYSIFASLAGGLTAGVNQTFSGSVLFDPVSGAPFAVRSNVRVQSLNADLLDGLHSSAFVRRDGDDMSGSLNIVQPAFLSLGAGYRQMLNLYGFDYALGVQPDTLYARSDGGFAWYRGGAHIDLTNSPGLGGARLMSLSRDGRLEVESNGGVAIRGMSSGGGLFGQVGVSGESGSLFGIGVQGSSPSGTGVRGSSSSGFAGYFDGLVEVRSDSTIQRPHLRLNETQDGDFARLEFRTASHPYWHIAVGGGAANQMNFYNSTNGDVMSLTEDGTLFTKVITIIGGSDIAEPFQMSEENLPKGAVVVIDDERPGHLKLSSEPYDLRVAGVISGANGVNPGLSLSQEGVLEGDQPVALSGRVYVQADSAFGAIKPGDQLTTSATPGHAMKVTERDRAQGAILGKAMSELEDGRGLVLVLVTLQ